MLPAREVRGRDRTTRDTRCHQQTTFKTWAASLLERAVRTFEVRGKDKSTKDAEFRKQTKFQIMNNNVAWKSGSRVSGKKDGQVNEGNTCSLTTTGFETCTTIPFEQVVPALRMRRRGRSTRGTFLHQQNKLQNMNSNFAWESVSRVSGEEKW